jgi:hypothetical protein
MGLGAALIFAGCGVLILGYLISSLMDVSARIKLAEKEQSDDADV